jgi:hypothetical protein
MHIPKKKRNKLTADSLIGLTKKGAILAIRKINSWYFLSNSLNNCNIKSDDVTVQLNFQLQS